MDPEGLTGGEEAEGLPVDDILNNRVDCRLTEFKSQG